MKNTKFVQLILIPSFLVLFIFTIFPLFYGLGISFLDYNPARHNNPFIGLENYMKLFQDPIFKKAVGNTLLFSVLGVCANIVITLFLAQLISILPKKGWKTLFRTILFIPCIAPMVGTSVVWKYGILQTDGGTLNQLCNLLGIPPKNWFGTTTALLMIIIVYTLWADIGYNVVLFTAGLESVPKEFDEAAKIDGASSIRRFLSIRLPLMGRTFAFVFIMTMANYFQMFAQFKILSPKGGVGKSSMVLTNYIYTQSFTSNDMGYASAIATALFFIIFIVALIQNRMMRADWSYE
ncbi:carbohydrate ABC transporter permease [Lachnospiraceae bacterium LCP25S3_G4]